MDAYRPLADRMRPADLAEYVGQPHVLAPGRPLREALESGHLHSFVLWGPPGTGKTTLARLVAQRVEADFLSLSAVLAGVKDIRAAVESAERLRNLEGRATVLFVDEVHRFNKAQQDAFLPFVENGTVTFIGATTENPSFELNSALLSRARVYVLKRLDEGDLEALLERALADPERGLGALDVNCEAEQRARLARAADGDARRALNLLELAADLASAEPGRRIDETVVDAVLTDTLRRFDKGGDLFYDQISALHKAVRGSAPDAALYWLARMLDGGCDALYIARRVVRMASEDIGNADPRALQLALQAWDVQERLGSPEGELAIAQAVVYLACAAKSNAVYNAFGAARADARSGGSLDVPMHLRNAPTKLMKNLGHGSGYRYAHDEPEGYAAGETYFPPELGERSYYQPVDRGLEQRIAEKLRHLRALDRQWRATHKARKPD
ncbi:replication-associated recombination protein A [Ectothiorhodospiraceae bacterium 2226]|nr:replication-associated recombination protein A [Ectothiorhodospiraceae bacterium 2226]